MKTASLSNDLVARVQELRPLPAIAIELMQMLRDPDIDARPVEERLARDPVITARVLQLANSPFFGTSGQVRTIRDAIAILGLRRVGSVTIAAATQQVLTSDDPSAFDLDAFWAHSALVAGLAGRLADTLNIDPNTASCAGLLHDIGRLAIGCLAPAEMRDISARCAEQDEQPVSIERELLDTDHAEIGHALASHWNLAPDLRDAIGQHHSAQAKAGSLEALVQIADSLAHALGVGSDAVQYVPPISSELWGAMNISDKTIQSLLRWGQSQSA